MRIRTNLAFCAAGFLCGGCVNMIYEKTVAVTRDGNGVITQTTETETVVQKNQQGWPVKLEHLKGGQPNGPK